jgi:succinate dehydrogenase/fumarate reductase flavoprotein subunit
LGKIQNCPVLVVGGSLAGLRAAIAAYDGGCDAAVLSKVYPIRSHSGAAQGGINAALANHPEGKDDSWDRHALNMKMYSLPHMSPQNENIREQRPTQHT